MKTKLILAATLLAFSTLAQAMPVKPAKCPSPASLAANGLNRNTVALDRDGLWAVGMMKNKYDTRDPWTFVIGRIRANNADDAFQKATANLSSLSFQVGPIAVERINRWGCGYNTAAGYTASAFTPNLEGITITTVAHALN